ncbi:MAG TPA: hypothetical protein VFM80_03165 [Gracilimonas sp.]|uniref:hypothetical protein n=1 Tax=Gracilimonas sp. TaxID=1974203 RepID=UPI002DA64EEF|nr:hypothetical protein [Gracilimonas sp.]
MTRTNKGFISLCISLLTLVLIFNGCEDPGSVGNNFIEEPVVVYDTLSLDNVTSENYSGYSGNFGFTAIGSYSDQTFGDIEAMSLMKPIREPSIPDSLGIDGNNFSFKLELQLDSTNTYGDTLSVSEFSIYEVTSLWRGNSHRIDTDVTYDNTTEIGSFTIGQEKNIIVNLDDAWKDKYATYLNNEDANADSLYRYEFLGLVIVPTGNTNKISFPRNDSRFLILTEDQSDTVAVSLSSFAYNLDRSNVNQSPTNTSLHSTIEELMKINFPLAQIRENHQSSNILRADLVLYEDTNTLSSSLPVNHSRPNVNFVSLSFGVSSDEVYEYQIRQPNFTGSRVSDGPYFKADITTYLNNILYGQEERDEMVIGIGSNSGIIRSTLLHNESASTELRPKLIITSIVNEDN